MISQREYQLAVVFGHLAIISFALSIAAVHYGRPLLASFQFLLGVCAGALGLFFRSKEQNEGLNCFLFGLFAVAGIGAISLFVYAAIQNLSR